MSVSIIHLSSPSTCTRGGRPGGLSGASRAIADCNSQISNESFLVRVVPITRSPAAGSLHRAGCEDERGSVTGPAPFEGFIMAGWRAREGWLATGPESAPRLHLHLASPYNAQFLTPWPSFLFLSFSQAGRGDILYHYE